jgi:beta-glucosidase/6-phospho-beta-glucosidase/beta-galactosidase
MQNIRPFPEDFMFGVATADHQCEAYEAQFEDIRDVWERRRGLTARGRATDFWDRYTEDIILAKSMNPFTSHPRSRLCNCGSQR